MAKRIAIVLYFYQCSGGAHRYLHSVCEQWRKRGYEFEVWYYRAESTTPMPPYAHKLPVVYPVRFLYINRSLQLAASTAALITSRKMRGGFVPDVLVAIDAGEAMTISIIAALFGIEVVHNDRGTDDYFRLTLGALDYSYYKLARRLGRLFVHKWVVSSEAKALELAKIGIPDARMYIVPNGLRLYSMATNAVLASGEHDDTGSISIGYFSRPSSDRGIDIAFSIVRLINHSADIGGMLFFMTVDEQCIPEDLRAVEWVIPLGTLAHEDVAAWMAQVDIVVVPTRHESFGNTVLEGLYYGACVVASAAGSLAEWRESEGLVLVDDYENAEAWVETIAAIVPRLRHKPRRRFREELAAQFNLERQADALYHTFLGDEAL